MSLPLTRDHPVPTPGCRPLRTRMMGHASAAMTLDVYAGLFADDLDTVVAQLDVLGRAAAEGNADQLRTESPFSGREVLTLSSRSTA